MSKEEYAESTKKYVFPYLKGRTEEQNRIIKLINKTIKECKRERFAEYDEAIGILEELKEAIKK